VAGILTNRMLASLIAALWFSELASSALSAELRPRGVASAYGGDSVASRSDAKDFVSQLDSREILVLNSRGRIVQKIIANYPSSDVATDSAGNLYVSGDAKESAFEIFQAPTYKIYESVRLPAPVVGRVFVDARNGIFAVTTAHPHGPTEVNFFRHGETQPCRIVSEKLGSLVFAGYGGFDAAGVLYTAVNTDNGSFIASISGACGDGPVKVLTFKKPFKYFAEFTFNANDDLVIQATLSPNNCPIYTYRHPINGQVGLPIATTTLAPYRGETPFFQTFTSDGRHLLAGGFQAVGQYRYPAGGGPEWVRADGAGLSDASVVPPLRP